MKYSPKLINLIKKMSLKGMPPREISQKVGIDTQKIRYLKKEIQKKEKIIFPLAVNETKLQKVIKNVKEMSLKGFSPKEISRKIGLDTKRISNLKHNIQKKEGIKFPRHIKKSENNEDLKRIVKKLSLDGYKPKEISNITNEPYTRIKNIKNNLRTKGITFPNVRDKYSEGLFLEIEKLYKEGKTLKEIAKQLKISVSGLNKIRIRYSKEFGIKKKNYNKIKNLHDSTEEILQMKRAGLTIKEIAMKFGVKDSTISLLLSDLHKLGIYIPNYKRRVNSNLNESEINYRIEIIKKMQKEGKTKRKIAKFLNIGEDTLSTFIRRYL